MAKIVITRTPDRIPHVTGLANLISYERLASVLKDAGESAISGEARRTI